MEPPISLPPTNSLIGLPLNIRNSLVTSNQTEPPKTTLIKKPSSQTQAKMALIKIGGKRVLSPKLRTKVNADHAGHSPPLVQLKELM
jgi:hypothetical protein